jgi:hypothetical protein
MMDELEKQFFDTFGIEAKKQCYYWDCPYSTGNIVNDTAMNERDCNSCKNPNKEVYPQITDSILLELICIRCKELISMIKVKGKNVEELKNYILKLCIEDYTFNSKTSDKTYNELADNFKHQVRTLFEEG